MELRKILFIAFVSFLTNLGAGIGRASEQPELSYKIAFDSSRAIPSLLIELEFTGEPDGETELEVPSEWAGQQDYFLGIESIRLAREGAELLRLAPDRLLIKHAPNAALKLTYSLKQAWAKGVNGDGFYWPIVNNEYFHFFGVAAWILPSGSRWNGGREIRFHLEWAGLKDGATLANSHGAESKVQDFFTSTSHFKHAVYLGGDFRVISLEVEARPVRIALRGKWNFSDGELSGLAHKIIAAQRAFFSDFDYPYYLITLIPSDRPCCNRGGTGLINSFAMQASNLPNVEPFKHLLAHELFHNWNGRKIGRQEPEQLAYWFSEGFTDYYAWKINLLAGIIDFPTYVKEVNSVLAQYHRSPLKNAANKRILDEFWTNEGITRLPYVRGMLLAIRWNSMIRKFGVHSLDDFMRDLFQAAQQEGAVVSPETVDRLMRRFLPDGVAHDLEHLVENGETIELESGSLGMCARSVAKMLPGYDLGFDEKKSSDLGVINDLRIDTNAYRVGLREGMKIIRTGTRGNDPDLEVTVTIMRDDGTKMDFRYLPAGPEISIPQFELGGNCL